MTPSPKKKEKDDDSKVSELTSSPTKGKGITKADLNDAALDSPDPDTFFHFGGSTEANTDNSDTNADTLSLSMKQNKDVLDKNTNQGEEGAYICLEYTLFASLYMLFVLILDVFTHFLISFTHSYLLYTHFCFLITHFFIPMKTRKATRGRGSRRMHAQ